jgi:hypothetical protein
MDFYIGSWRHEPKPVMVRVITNQNGGHEPKHYTSWFVSPRTILTTDTNQNNSGNNNICAFISKLTLVRGDTNQNGGLTVLDSN